MKRQALLLLVALAATPALAQDDAANSAPVQGAAEPKVNQLIVYGEDTCPESTGEEITVCARLDEGERYRIPQSLRQIEGPANQAWANKVKSFEAVTNIGPLSCTAVGAGGELGCTAKMIEAAYAEKAQQHANNVHMAELVAQARTQRLSTLDADAAATQARVEAIEQERARLEAQGVPPAEAAARASQAVATAQPPSH